VSSNIAFKLHQCPKAVAVENALYAAAAGGHETVVRLLVTIGANVNAQGGEYGNALCAALVPLLLEKGADIKHSGYSLT